MPPVPSSPAGVRLAAPAEAAEALDCTTVNQGRYERPDGAGIVSPLGIRLSSDRGRPELNEGALHRYLAEAPRYPPALLPRSGLSWAPLGVFTAGHWGRFDGQYRRAAWEGRFSRYTVRAGMRVPGWGEVGWYASRPRRRVRNRRRDSRHVGRYLRPCPVERIRGARAPSEYDYDVVVGRCLARGHRVRTRDRQHGRARSWRVARLSAE